MDLHRAGCDHSARDKDHHEQTRQHAFPEQSSESFRYRQAVIIHSSLLEKCCNPSHKQDDEQPDQLFSPAPDNWRLEGWLAQIGWMFTLGHEGGLFFTIGQRR